MSEGRWADWQVRLIAENLAEKCPKRDWFETNDESYLTSLKSWSHITARQLYSMELEDRQVIIFIHTVKKMLQKKMSQSIVEIGMDIQSY